MIAKQYKYMVTFIILIGILLGSLLLATVYGGVTIPFKETVKVLLSLLPFISLFKPHAMRVCK